MKVSPKFVMMIAVGSMLITGSLAHAHGVTTAKAAELGLHRMERLVDLNRVEEAFQSKFKELKVEALAHQEEEDPSFKITLFQHPGSDGSQKQLTIVLDEEGRPLSFAAKLGADAVNSPDFGEKGVITLTENALHFVLENAKTRPDVAAFYNNLSHLSTALGINSTGDAAAIVDLHTASGNSVLRIRINFDGSFDSYETVVAAH